MKLYTEEQVKELLYRVKIITAENMHEHINHLTNGITPIELPSAKDIANKAEILFTLDEQESFIDGAKWMKQQIFKTAQ